MWFPLRGRSEGLSFFHDTAGTIRALGRLHPRPLVCAPLLLGSLAGPSRSQRQCGAIGLRDLWMLDRSVAGPLEGADHPRFQYGVCLGVHVQESALSLHLLRILGWSERVIALLGR